MKAECECVLLLCKLSAEHEQDGNEGRKGESVEDGGEEEEVAPHRSSSSRFFRAQSFTLTPALLSSAL